MGFRRKTRIEYDVIEREVYVPSYNESLLSVPSNWNMTEKAYTLPPIFTVEIQEKVLWFWIPIWEESCDYCDADARTKLDAKAK